MCVHACCVCSCVCMHVVCVQDVLLLVGHKRITVKPTYKGHPESGLCPNFPGQFTMQRDILGPSVQVTQASSALINRFHCNAIL